jgi:hypothetical protein
MSVRSDFNGVLSYFFLNPVRPMHGIVLALAAVGLVDCIVRERKRSPSIIFAIATSAGLVWYTSVRAPAANYNAMAFVPCALAILYRTTLSVSGAPMASVGWACTSGVAMLSVVPVLLSCYAAAFGATREQFHETVVAMEDRSLAVDMPLLVGAVPFRQWKLVQPLRTERPSCRGGPELVIMKQANTGLFEPRELPGCKVLLNMFAHKSDIGPAWWPFPAPKAYNFAVYGDSQE